MPKWTNQRRIRPFSEKTWDQLILSVIESTSVFPGWKTIKLQYFIILSEKIHEYIKSVIFLLKLPWIPLSSLCGVPSHCFKKCTALSSTSKHSLVTLDCLFISYTEKSQWADVTCSDSASPTQGFIAQSGNHWISFTGGKFEKPDIILMTRKQKLKLGK